MNRRLNLSLFLSAIYPLLAVCHGQSYAAESPDEAALQAEVHSKGWIVFSSRSDRGDYDLFICRPDGSARTNITRTPEFNEAWPRYSSDGTKLMYRRLHRDQTIDGNRYGEQGILVMAQSNGSQPKTFGDDGDYPWAGWNQDCSQLLCMSQKGFSIVDIASRKIVRTFPRQGFFQQTTWSPDGKWLVGVANSFGTSWSIARLNIASGAATAVNTIDCCTPDWFPDSANVIFSWRTAVEGINNGYGWTQLWRADAEGKSNRLVYAEEGRHIYGGHVSPDGKYVLFTGNVQEDGDPGSSGAPMGLMRLSDAPVIRGKNTELRARFPNAGTGTVLTLPLGWEPCWTFSETPGKP